MGLVLILPICAQFDDLLNHLASLVAAYDCKTLLFGTNLAFASVQKILFVKGRVLFHVEVVVQIRHSSPDLYRKKLDYEYSVTTISLSF